MEIGEQRLLFAQSDTIVSVEIKCFVQNPPPPGYKPCPSCGTLEAKPGRPVSITASAEVFSISRGTLEIRVRDESGDERHFSVPIIRRGGVSAETGTDPLDGLPSDELTKLRTINGWIPKKSLLD
jgi:hypothetical protein